MKQDEAKILQTCDDLERTSAQPDLKILAQQMIVLALMWTFVLHLKNFYLYASDVIFIIVRQSKERLQPQLLPVWKPNKW